MALPEYRPLLYQRLRAGGTENAFSSMPFDKEAFVQACLQSETSTVTIDLSNEEKVRAFADQVERFHPALLDAVVKWVNDPDKEHARDCVHLAGWLPGELPRTASQEMWEKGYTFMDVIVEAQRRNLNPPANVRDEVFLSVSYGSPDQRGTFIRSEQAKPELGLIGRIANRLSGGAYERSLEEQQRQEMRSTLSQSPPETTRSANAAHNREVLRAEQMVRDCNERLSEYSRAKTLLGEREQELARRVERDRELTARLKEQRGTAEDCDSYDDVDAHGSTVRMDISREAQLLRRIELEETRRVLEQVRLTHDRFERAALQEKEQLAALRVGTMTETGNEAVQWNFDGDSDGITARILKACRSKASPPAISLDGSKMEPLLSARETFEQALEQKMRVDGYQKFRREFNELSEHADKLRENAMLNVQQSEQFMTAASDYLHTVEQLANYALGTHAFKLGEPERTALQETANMLHTFANSGVSHDEAAQSRLSERLEQAAGLTQRLCETVQSACKKDSGFAEWERHPEQIRQQAEDGVNRTRETYQKELAAGRARLEDSILCSVADRAAVVNSMQQTVRERITRDMLMNGESSENRRLRQPVPRDWSRPEPGKIADRGK